jgi:serine/threonine protein kinase
MSDIQLLWAGSQNDSDEIRTIIGTNSSGGCISQVRRWRGKPGTTLAHLMFAVKHIRITQCDLHLVRKMNREIDTLKKLRHRHVIRYVADYEDNGEKCLVMELASGGTLADYIQTQPMPQQVMVTLSEIASALKYIDSQGVIHADIRPENLLLDSAGVIKLAGFGLAVYSDPDKFEPHSPVASGTQCTNTSHVYFSPERSSGQDYNARDDVWAAGVVLLELVLGRRITAPFWNDEASAAQYIAEVEGRWSPLEDFARKMLMFDPRQRICSWALREELKTCMQKHDLVVKVCALECKTNLALVFEA